MNLNLGDKERFVSNTWYLGISQVVGAGATYLLLFVLTRLGAERYGLWVLALLLVSYLTPWATLGLNNSLVRFCPAYPAARQRAAGYRLACLASLGFSGLIALGMIAAARPLAGLLLGEPDRWGLVVLAALLFPAEAQFKIGNSFLQAQERLGLYALLTALRYLSEVVVLGALVCWLPDLAVMMGARGLVVLAFVLTQHLAIRQQGAAPVAGFDYRGELRRYLQFGFPIIPAAFIWGLVMGVDRFMLERLGELSEVAVYNMADVVAVFLLNFTRPINGILQPRFANLLDRRPEEVQLYLGGALKYLAILLFPGVVGMAMAAGPLVELIGPPGFERAAGMVPLLAVAYVLIGLSNPFYHLVFLRRGGRVFLWLYSLCLAVNGLLNWWLIPAWGGKGAALATLGCFLVYVAGLLVCSEAQTLRTLAGQWRPLGVIAGCSALMGLVLLVAMSAHPAFDSLALVPLGIVVYGGLLSATRLISPREWQLLLSPLLALKAVLGTRLRATRLS